jgi:hypothetical protein
VCRRFSGLWDGTAALLTGYRTCTGSEDVVVHKVQLVHGGQGPLGKKSAHLVKVSVYIVPHHGAGIPNVLVEVGHKLPPCRIHCETSWLLPAY